MTDRDHQRSQADMTTQWHPIFAKLLRPLVEAYYEVETDMPVGDLPRTADIVLLRRTSVGALPFTGLWRWLTPWNILEFKGPTVSGRVDDLDMLLELGLGIHRRLNEERVKQGQGKVQRRDVSFWYLANRLGTRFRRAAADLLGPLESLGPGVWRVGQLHRSLMLVSGQEVPVDRDSLPVHLLAEEPEEQQRAVARVLGKNLDLLPIYGGWLATAHPAISAEVVGMAKTKTKKFALNVGPLFQHLGWQEIIRQVGLKSLIDEVGVKPVIDQMGVKAMIDHVGVKALIDQVGLNRVVSQLTPEQRKELQRLLEKTSPQTK